MVACTNRQTDIVQLVKNFEFLVQQGILWQRRLAKQVTVRAYQALNEFVSRLILVDHLVKVPRRNHALLLTNHPMVSLLSDDCMSSRDTSGPT